ncbi:MAG: general secretion pathway protein GspK, partial [Deltaproteobacteria bacterium]|nr:general secretion pathway protein GspK [Deltaproteobacteria bacterium]
GGLSGEPRLLIVDEDGKIDINQIASRSAGRAAGQQAGEQPQGAQQASRVPGEFWRDTLSTLFSGMGFVRESYEPREFRTIGDAGLDGPSQVATIIDFIDSDKTSYTRAGFDGEGLESQMTKGIFFNRKFASLGEVLFVPGMTLERLMRIAPYVKVSESARNTQVNVNTTPIEVLLAMGFPERDAVELIQERMSAPIKNENLGTIALGDPTLKSYLKVTTDEFAVYVRVMSANTSRWLRASVSAPPGNPRRTSITSMELH